MRLDPHAPNYPRSLCHLDEPPPITVSGDLRSHRRRVAIVGSRTASEDASRFAFQLAYHLARAGVIVVSGGAIGVDRMAHLGALQGDGATWCVACCGRGQVFPEDNRELFAMLEASSSSRMIWPFPDGMPKDETSPRYRNGVLVGLAECVVVIQAAYRSGSLNAAGWAEHLGRPLFVVPSMPWDHAFLGSTRLGARGARPLWSIEWFFAKLGLPKPNIRDKGAAVRGIMPLSAPIRQRQVRKASYADGPLFAVDRSQWTDEEKLVFSMLSLAPTQQDEVVVRSGLPTSSTLTALLTLSLKDVVVEGPDGFFRRRVKV